MSKISLPLYSSSLDLTGFTENNKIVSQIGKAIRYHRNQMGMTQQEFSELMGFNRTYLSSIERGERNISLITLINISKYLDVSIVELVSF
ncbi:MAG: helix-turn-helix transcriptional regulator [Patescibacteria group bacterium]